MSFLSNEHIINNIEKYPQSLSTPSDFHFTILCNVKSFYLFRNGNANRRRVVKDI